VVVWTIKNITALIKYGGIVITSPLEI
jgi:hypothetical protein